MKAKISEDEFIRLFPQLGAAELARRIGTDQRKVLERRRAIEKRRSIVLDPPGKASVHHPAVQTIDIPDGRVVVFSDAHFWPGESSTAHKALLEIIKEFTPKLVVANGDMFDGATVSRHTPINFEQRPKVCEELDAVRERLGEIEKVSKKSEKIWTLGNHDCLSPDTQCLTKRGWKNKADLSLDDFILSMDGDKAVWSKINEIVEFDYDGKLLVHEDLRFRCAVTPNHRILLWRRNWRTAKEDIQEYIKADSLPSRFSVPSSGTLDIADYDISDNWLALIGWLLTDGCFSGADVTLHQSKPEGVREISRLLDALGMSYNMSVRRRNITHVCGRKLIKPPLDEHHFYLTRDSSRTIHEYLTTKTSLPPCVYYISGRQFNILLDAIVAGNGHWNTATNCTVYGLEPILSSMQSLAVCHGWRAPLTQENRGHYRLSLTKFDRLSVLKGGFRTEPYKGKVWCLRVPHGNFMVRHHGTCYFTGNSRFETFLATNAPQYEKVEGTSLKDHFRAWTNAWAVHINNNTVVKHRFKGGQHAPYTNVTKAGWNIITGHLHSQKVYPITNYTGTLFGCDSGCLAAVKGPQFENYTEASVTDWRSGFAIAHFHQRSLIDIELVRVLDEERGLVVFRGEVISV